eukprot:1191938-Prorocentrum_minimum.AAC.3
MPDIDEFNFIHRHTKTKEHAFGTEFTIAEYPTKKGTGTEVWRVSRVLLWYLWQNYDKGQLVGKRVVELGCGAGLVGVGLGVHGISKEVVLTDHQDHVVELADFNVRLNGCEAKCKVGQRASQLSRVRFPAAVQLYPPRC